MFHTDEYIQLTKRILKGAPAEKIFLLATTHVQRKTESIFVTEAPKQDLTEHYYLLVLIRRNREQSNNTVQEKIETLCNPVSPVTAFVIDIELFNDWLLEGQPFACQVKEKALQLFDDLSILLPDPATIDKEALKQANEVTYCQGLNKVHEFLAGADLYRIRKQNKMAAFMLHQAAEHSLLTILKITIGLGVNSHNLEKLVRYCSLVTCKVTDVFQKNKENDKRLFQLLQRAYIETRYKEGYSINTSDLQTLTEKIRVLQEILVSLNHTSYAPVSAV